MSSLFYNYSERDPQTVKVTWNHYARLHRNSSKKLRAWEISGIEQCVYWGIVLEKEAVDNVSFWGKLREINSIVVLGNGCTCGLSRVWMLYTWWNNHCSYQNYLLKLDLQAVCSCAYNNRRLSWGALWFYFDNTNFAKGIIKWKNFACVYISTYVDGVEY